MMSYVRFILLTLSFLVCSCTKSSNTPEVEYNIVITPTEKYVDSTINEFVVSVESNYIWTIECNADWVTITPSNSSFQNAQNLRIRVAANTDQLARSATISFTCDTKIVELTITQEAFKPYINLSEKAILFGYRMAEKQICIISNCGWYAKPSADWIKISPSTGLIGNFDMVINVNTNDTEKERVGFIAVWNNDYQIEERIEISQSRYTPSNDKEYIDEYGINYGYGIDINGLIWAPVNCGYHATLFPYGQMYQWGRKYGVGYYSDNYTQEEKPTIATLWEGQNGMEDSHTFYKQSSTSRYGYDWIANGDDAFWNSGTDENPIKNLKYDPCPDGWRVPTSYEMQSLLLNIEYAWSQQNEINGLLLDDKKTTLFLPAGGRLDISDGKGYDRPTNGYYWTSSASLGVSSFLYFHAQNYYLNSNGSRAGGCLLRCVKE